MKISPKQYAHSLSEAVEGLAPFAEVTSAIKAESEKEARIFMERFLKILENNNDSKKLPKIISEMEKIKESESGVKKAKLVTAVELSDGAKKEAARKLESIFKKKIELSAKTEPEILGGMIIEAGNEILDASVRAMINKFKHVLSV